VSGLSYLSNVKRGRNP